MLPVTLAGSQSIDLCRPSTVHPVHAVHPVQHVQHVRPSHSSHVSYLSQPIHTTADSSAGFRDPQCSVAGAMAYRLLDSRFRGNDSCVMTAVEHVIATRAHVIPGPDRESSLPPTQMLLARLWRRAKKPADGYKMYSPFAVKLL